MVGVAGKSQGCNTCRKRRVKCDRGKPCCGQCTKSKRECSGYQRIRHFKNLSALDHETLIVRKQPLNPITEPSFIRYDHSDAQSKQVGRESRSESPTVKWPESAAISLSRLFDHFLFDYIPQRGTVKYEPPVSWLQTVLNNDNIGCNTSLPLAASALSLVRLGRKYEKVDLQKKGIALYGRALEGLQAILSNDDKILEEQTLASCMILLVFEVLQTCGSNVQGWTSHIQGISRLFQLRGPGLHISESSHRLFLGFRSTGIIYALAARKSSYFGDEEWLTIPWQTFPKSDFHHLLDIMARIPDLIEQTELAVSRGLILLSPIEVVALHERYWAMERQLRMWYISLVESSCTPLYSETALKAIDSTTLSNFQPFPGPSIIFPTFEIARIHLFYWAALLLIYNNLTCLSSASTSVHEVPEVNVESEIRKTAMLIARSILYFLTPKAQTMGPQIVCFPLRVAMHAFSELEEGRDERWCMNVFEEIDKRGVPLGKILANVEWDGIPRLFT